MAIIMYSGERVERIIYVVKDTCTFGEDARRDTRERTLYYMQRSAETIKRGKRVAGGGGRGAIRRDESEDATREFASRNTGLSRTLLEFLLLGACFASKRGRGEIYDSADDNRRQISRFSFGAGYSRGIFTRYAICRGALQYFSGVTPSRLEPLPNRW